MMTWLTNVVVWRWSLVRVEEDSDRRPRRSR